MKVTRAEAQVLETSAHTPEYLIRELRRKLDESEGRQITINVKSGDLATIRWILNPHVHDKPRHVLLSIAAAILIGGSALISPANARAHRVDTCAAVWDELVEKGYDPETGGGDVVLATVGCEEDLSRAGNACNRYAHRLAHAWMHADPGRGITPLLIPLIEAVEQYESNGHPCGHFEDGSYGFPDKMIDCMVDPRC